jgi:hypothetical protein
MIDLTLSLAVFRREGRIRKTSAAVTTLITLDGFCSAGSFESSCEANGTGPCLRIGAAVRAIWKILHFLFHKD